MSILDLYPDSTLNQKDSSENNNSSKKLILSDDFKNTLNLLPHFLWVSKGNVGYFNTAMKEYLGVDTDYLNDREWVRFFHPDDAEHIYVLWKNAKKTGRRFEKECRIKNQAGEYIWFNLVGEYHLKQKNNLDWVVSCTNIHDRMIKLREATDMLRTNSEMLDISLDCIKTMTPSGQLIHMNRSGCLALFGQEKVNKFGMNWCDLLPLAMRLKAQQAIDTAAKGISARFVGKTVNANKMTYWDNTLTPVLNDLGETISILCVSRDITSKCIAEQKVKYLSEYDELTGLTNRIAFKNQLKQCLTDAKEQNNHLGIMFIDLDYFKNINDSLGYSAGDHLLQVLSKRFSKCLNINAYFSRIGGDEFAVIVPNMTKTEDLERVALKVLEQNDLPITFSGKIINSGMSIGCAQYPQDATDVMGLMKCADTALNDLKERGRGGIRLYNPEMLILAKKKTAQLYTARSILRENRIEPFYQAKVRLDNQQLIGFEALLRWREEDKNIQHPASIFEAFSDYELATKISEVMHAKIFSDMAVWIKAGLNLVPVSINVSPVEFMRDNYAELLIQRLEHYQIPINLIEIEITEHVFSENGSDHIIRALTKLKEYGLRISLDDFGTGHSSMTHLRNYPVDCIKIDCSFVGRMNEDKSIKSIVEGIARLGPILSLDVIAEGIETLEQAKALELFGCKYGQGFLFGRAVCAEDARILLTNNIKN